MLKAALIFVACFWIYSPVYHGEWLWDDDYLLTNNADVQATDGLGRLWFAPATADYLPLTMSALWLQWRLFGLDSTGYHIVSIALHALSSCLLWGLLRQMRLRGAWFAGLLFAVHPVCVESVAWISELKNTLSLPFLLAAAWCVVRFEQGAGRRFYFAALGLFLAAMLSKSSVVMFPCVMLLHAWWLRGRISWCDVQHSAPFFVVSLLLGLITLHFQLDRAIGSEPIPIGGFDSRLAIAGMAVLFYLSKIIWPVTLLPIYPQWKANPPEAYQLLPWLLVAAALAFFWIHRKTWGRHALMAFGFYLITLLPVLGFVSMSYMRVGWVADHFLYLPMMGVLAWIVSTGAEIWKNQGEAVQQWLLSLSIIVFGALAMLSLEYSQIWENEDKLWSYTLQHNWNCWQAHNRLGSREFNRGKVDIALPHFREAVRLRPDLAETRNNLGSGILATKDTKGAIAEFREARRLSPTIVAIDANLARALLLDGQLEEASGIYADLVRRFPSNPIFHCNLGVSLFHWGKKQEAIQCFEEALRLNPHLPDAQSNLDSARKSLIEN
ncbi:MAG: tetratricopeptide repeat protein [bacterium]